MPNILLTWELGAGLGHLARLLPLARGLCERGHQVSLASRDLSRVEKVFAGTGVAYLEAPVKTRKGRNHFDPPRTVPHILHNNGFADPDELRAMTLAWRNLYGHVGPDLIIFDHSPMALFAAQGNPARKALIGTGFCCPVDAYPMADLRPWLPDACEQLRLDEDGVLEQVNRLLDD